MQLEELFQRLWEHDPDWLSHTLYDRWIHLVHQEKPDAKLRNVSNQTPIWPFDVTLPYVPEGLEITEYVQFIRSYDWSATALGPMSKWSIDLRRMVNMCLCEQRPAALWVGTEHVGFYNEEYAHLTGGKHPYCLGKPFRELWPEPEVSEVFHRKFDAAIQSGKPSKGDDVRFIINRNGYREEVWNSFTVMPLSDSAGGVFGCYNTSLDVTATHVFARRLSTILRLGQATSSATNIEEFWEKIIQGLEPNTSDIPFIAVYSHISESDENEIERKILCRSCDSEYTKRWSLAGTIGVPPDCHELPSALDIAEATALFSGEFRQALASGQPLVLRKADSTFPKFLDGIARDRVDGDDCDTLVLFSVNPTNREAIPGFMLLGINPLIKYDLDYRQFVDLLSRQCTTSLASVVLIEEKIKAAEIAASNHSKLSAQLAESKQEILDNESRFRHMADLSPVAMFHLDEHGKVLYANKNWMELTQHPLDSWGAMSWYDDIHPDDKELVDVEWTKLQNGTPVNFEMRWNRPYAPQPREFVDGQPVEGATWTIASAYSEKRLDGTVKGILGCLTDISRQKWLEGFQARKMQEVVNLKEQQSNFIDVFSHEARNPLSAMMLCAESMLETFQRLNSDDPQADPINLSREDLEIQLQGGEIIMTCAQHQKRIMDDVLTLSKLESGLLVLCPIEMQPVTTISQGLKMFEGEAQKCGITLTLSIDQTYHDLKIDWVRLDPSRLLQVLINLLTNAVKFTKSEPIRRISVTLCATSARPVTSLHGAEYIPDEWASPGTECEEDDVFIGLEVIDTGRGITPDEMTRLFQRFQQASPKTHVEYGGSGLGLFISRRLTRMQGGAIGVASPGKGATFAFYLKAPRCPAPTPTRADSIHTSTTMHSRGTDESDSKRHKSAEEASFPPAKDPATSRYHILVVEDNLINQKVLRSQLMRQEHTVAVANHGLEALDHIRITDFYDEDGIRLDVVLLDVEMPVCNGFECARRIRQLQRSGEIRGHVPIIGLTANARAEQQSAAIESGMDAVVTKPFRLQELLVELDRITMHFRRAW